MTNSMTAFARCEKEGDWGELIWEIRSVNHRYLEVFLRLPEELRAEEPAFRQIIGKQVRRGRVDAGLRYTPANAQTGRLDFDTEVVRNLGATAGQVYRVIPQLQPLRTIDVLQWPGVIKAQALDTDAMASTARSLLQQVLTEMSENRRREGIELAEMIRQRLDAARDIVANLKNALPEVKDNVRERLENRIAEIRDELDPGRLEQELVLLLNKMDVDEEIGRLEVHLEETRRVLERQEPVGRRLDFLMQELNREANTLGSKSADQRMTDASVELKVLIDQIREQVQNIE